MEIPHSANCPWWRDWHACDCGALNARGVDMSEAEAPVVRAKIKGTANVQMAQQAQLEAYRSIMVAAAKELEDHWAAHCDKSGAGPVTLLNYLRGRRPVTGVPYPELLKEFGVPSDV
jgi:hypothetical protein